MNIYLFYAFIFVIIFYFIIHPIINYWPWINWWNSNNKQGYTCVDLISFAFAKQNYITYKIYNLFNSEPNQVTDVEIDFVTMLLEVYSTKVGGFMLPRNLCGTLTPEQLLNGQPWPTDDNGWKELLYDWANIPQGTTFQNVNEYTNAVKDTTKWTTDTTNFLYQQWGIVPAAPVVVAYLTNFSGDGSTNQHLYSQMMRNLLIPSTEGVGGWVGFLRGGKEILQDIDTIYNVIWQQVENFPKKVTDHSNQAKGCGTGQIVSSVSGGLMAGIMTAVMLGSAEVLGPFGIFIGLIVGAITAAGPIISCNATNNT
jgi:hypothetical protein